MFSDDRSDERQEIVYTPTIPKHLNPHCKLQTAKLPTAHCPLPTANCQLPTANCKLQNCPLQTANCKTAHCKLQTAKLQNCKTANCKTAKLPLFFIQNTFIDSFFRIGIKLYFFITFLTQSHIKKFYHQGEEDSEV